MVRDNRPASDWNTLRWALMCWDWFGVSGTLWTGVSKRRFLCSVVDLPVHLRNHMLIWNSFFILLKTAACTAFTSNVLPLPSCQPLRAIISNETLKQLSHCANCSSVGGDSLRDVCFSGWHPTLVHYLKAWVKAIFGKNSIDKLNLNKNYQTATNATVCKTNTLVINWLVRSILM